MEQWAMIRIILVIMVKLLKLNVIIKRFCWWEIQNKVIAFDKTFYFLAWIKKSSRRESFFQNYTQLKLFRLSTKGSSARKACILYFLIFFQRKSFQKLWKIVFILSSKLFSFSRYSISRNFSPFRSFQMQRVRWKWNNYDVVNWLSKISPCQCWNNSETTLY